MVDMAFNSLKNIEEKFNFSPTLINCRFIKPFDTDILDEIITNHDYIITIEEGCLSGGFGSAILDYYNNKKYLIKVKKMGIDDHFVDHGTRKELLDLVGLNQESLMTIISDYFKENNG